MKKVIAALLLGMIATTAMAEGGSDRLIERQNQAHEQSVRGG